MKKNTFKGIVFLFLIGLTFACNFITPIITVPSVDNNLYSSWNDRDGTIFIQMYDKNKEMLCDIDTKINSNDQVYKYWDDKTNNIFWILNIGEDIVDIDDDSVFYIEIENNSVCKFVFWGDNLLSRRQGIYLDVPTFMRKMVGLSN